MKLRKIVLVGPESVGKTTLTCQLAEHFDTTWVAEYGRAYCEKYGNDCDALDHCHIAAGQLYYEDLAAEKARNGLLFCDTDVLTTQTFAELYLGHSPPLLEALARSRHYDHWLLLSPDVPFVPDHLRLFGDRRQWHFNRLRQLLTERRLPFSILLGHDYDDRFRAAVQRVHEHTGA